MSRYFSQLTRLQNTMNQEDAPHQIFRSSVAILVRPDDHICMIRRAVNEGDYWSGHMGFPGGRESSNDHSLLQTAMRETKEEIDVLLDQKQLCGRLSDLQHPRLQVAAFVFSVPQNLKCVPEISEVAEIHWLPLSAFESTRSRDSRTATYKDQTYQAPVVNIGTADVWGLSLKFIDNLLLLLG